MSARGTPIDPSEIHPNQLAALSPDFLPEWIFKASFTQSAMNKAVAESFQKCLSREETIDVIAHVYFDLYVATVQAFTKYVEENPARVANPS